MLPGSLPGTLLGKVLPKTRKEQLPTMFWLCSIGVNSVIKASGMTVSEGELRSKMDELASIAREQIRAGE